MILNDILYLGFQGPFSEPLQATHWGWTSPSADSYGQYKFLQVHPVPT